MTAALWDTFASRIIIRARLEAATALRIGAGGSDAAQPSAADLPVLVGPDDQPFIPGASLRGVLRSQVERIVRTLEPGAPGEFAGRGACNPVDERGWCIPNKLMEDTWRPRVRRLRREDQDADAWLAEQVWGHSCRICRVFGNTWLASRVRIADLHLVAGQTVRPERRDGVAIHRDKETVQHKYDFETVPAGSAFELRVTAENLGGAERGLLWLGLRELADGAILLGGFKGRGLGRARLAETSIAGVEAGDRAALKRYLLSGELTDMLGLADGWLETLWNELGVA